MCCNGISRILYVALNLNFRYDYFKMITTESISTPCFSFIAKQAIFSTREHRNSILFVSLVSAAPCCYRKLYPLHKRVLYITIHNRFYKYLFPRTFTDVIIDFFSQACYCHCENWP